MSANPVSAGKRLLTRLSLAIPAPQGKILNPDQTELVISDWKKEAKAISVKHDTMQVLAEDITGRIGNLAGDIPRALTELTEAKRGYKKAKSPIAKRKWAAKLIVRSKYYNYMRQSHKALISNSERVADAVEDAQVVYELLTNRIKDAEIYYRLNGQLKLVGRILVDARTKFPMPEMQYQNFEFTMESLEKEISGYDEAKLIGEANSLYDTINEGKKNEDVASKES